MKTPMQELLATLKDERESLPMTKEWGKCYESIELLIEHMFLEKEKEVIENAYIEGCGDNILCESTDKKRAEEYYNETFNTEEK